MNNPLVSILIVTWNRRIPLMRSIESALAQTYPNKEVVVVDNASSDGTAEMVRNSYPSVRLASTGENLGCPSGRNFGFGYCRGEYIYMLDDDGWLKADAIEMAVQRMAQSPRLGVVMSCIHEMGHDRPVAVRPLEQPVYQSVFSGGCSMIRREAWEKAGPYPEGFFRQGEESDLALRLLEHGFFCFLEPRSVMYHASSRTAGSNKQNIYYTLRNTNRTGLLLWPFPWCFLKALWNIVHSLRFMISMRYPALPILVFKDLLIDLCRFAHARKPVSSQTYKLFRLLSKSPCKELPICGT